MHVGFADRSIEQEGDATCRANQIEQQMNGGRLAGSIRSEEPEDFALLHLKVQHLHGRGFILPESCSIGLAQILGADRGHLGYSFVIPFTRFCTSASLTRFPTVIDCTTPVLSTSTDVGIPRTPYLSPTTPS